MRSLVSTASLAALVLVGGACRTVTPTRQAAPLPDETSFAVGATGGLGGGVGANDLNNTDLSGVFLTLNGGGYVTARALKLDLLALELDAGLGGAVSPYDDGVHSGLGLVVAARAWLTPTGRFAYGAEIGTDSGLQLTPTVGAPFVWVQPRARVLIAWQVLDDLYLSVMPGLFASYTFSHRLILTFPPGGALPFGWVQGDLPLALTIDVAPFRLFAEVGVAAWAPLPLFVPSVHMGAGAMVTF